MLQMPPGILVSYQPVNKLSAETKGALNFKYPMFMHILLGKDSTLMA